MPATARSNADFPLPLSPSSAVIPLGIDNVISSNNFVPLQHIDRCEQLILACILTDSAVLQSAHHNTHRWQHAIP